MLNASCNASGIVSVSGQTIDADILSEGTKASSGVALIDKDNVKYLTSNASDIKDLILALVDIIDQLSLIATGLDSVTLSPGAQAANITQLGVLKTQLEATAETLK